MSWNIGPNLPVSAHAVSRNEIYSLVRGRAGHCRALAHAGVRDLDLVAALEQETAR